jgi:hypothetical protein
MGLAVSAVTWGSFYDWDKPYLNVDRGSVEIVDSRLHYIATFKKTDNCKFDLLVPFRWVAGQPVRTSFFDLPDFEQPEDRLPGWHTLAISIPLGPVIPEEIEIRVRHKCIEPATETTEETFHYVSSTFDTISLDELLND